MVVAGAAPVCACILPHARNCSKVRAHERHGTTHGEIKRHWGR